MRLRIWLTAVLGISWVAACGYHPQRQDGGPNSGGGAGGGWDGQVDLADAPLGDANDGSEQDRPMVTPSGGGGGAAGAGTGGGGPANGGAPGRGGVTTTVSSGGDGGITARGGAGTGGAMAGGGASGLGGATASSGAGGIGPVATGGASTSVTPTGGSGTGGRATSGTGGSVTGTGGSVTGTGGSVTGTGGDVTGTGGSTTPCYATGLGGSCASPTVNHWANWPMPTNAAPHRHSYASLAPGIVLDSVTGLIWQGSPGTVPGTGCTARFNGDQANCYCSSLSLGGWTSGWRLPSRIELVSLIDFSRIGPAIDPLMFPNSDFPYISSSPAAADPSLVWQIDFENATIAVPDGLRRTTQNWFVRCVHDPATPRPAPSPRYTVSSDMVTDNGTTLVWEKAYRGPALWPDVKSICTGVTTGGKAGWRMPAIAELLTLVDETILPPGPVLDTSVFDMPSGTDVAFTSGTLAVGYTSEIPWRVFFLDGGTLPTDGGNHYARCVRDGP